MSKNAGYTEAELLALEWSKKNKKKPENQNRLEHNPMRRNDREERSYYSSSSTRRDDSHDCNDRFNGRRINDHHRDRNYRDDSRDRHSVRTDDRDRSSHRNVNYYDEFGRIQSSREHRIESHSSSSSRYGSRTRSRSRSRSPIRRRAYEEDLDQEKIYHRERDEKQRRIDNSWSHDKFDRDDTEVRPRRVDPDYQPPPPKWISKAGGVAIINRSA